MRHNKKIALSVSAIVLGGASFAVARKYGKHFPALARYKTIRAWGKLRMLWDAPWDIAQTADEVLERHAFLDTLQNLGWPVNANTTISGNGPDMIVNLVGGNPGISLWITLEGSMTHFKVIEFMNDSGHLDTNLPQAAALPNLHYMDFRQACSQHGLYDQ